LAQHSRWDAWEADVLARLPEPNEAQTVILERQGQANVELDDAEIVEEFFAAELNKLEYDPVTIQVRIPVAIAANWFKKAMGDSRMGTTGASRKLQQLIEETPIKKRLARDPSRTHGRGFIWTGSKADPFREIENALGERFDRVQQGRGWH
jgi:hypothetical protein